MPKPPNAGQSEEAKARAYLAKLEADPKQQHPDPKAIEETRHHALDDPKHQGKPWDEKSPGGWKKMDDGSWTHPDYEKVDEE